MKPFSTPENASFPSSPLDPFLESGDVMILDGGLATTLEAHGCDLDDPLWSAGVLLEAPEMIAAVHREFLAAGADCITAATYQASIPGFKNRGMSTGQAAERMLSAVQLALQARADCRSRDDGRPRPLVAASIGPFGAFLADGSEYSGNYGVSRADLMSFHEPRWSILAESGADLLACETLPSLPETEVLLELVSRPGAPWAWMSFSCRDESRLHDGTPLVEAARRCDSVERVAAVGINCTAPALVTSLLAEARRGTKKPLLVYPNSGESYDARSKEWRPATGSSDWGDLPEEWLAAGAVAIGGCCRIDPAAIARLCTRLIG